MAVSSIDRKFGFFPVSIATSLAFEGITRTGDYEDRPGEPEIKKISCLWVNLRTLVRNAINAFDSETQNRLTDETIWECVKEDWDGIKLTMGEMAPACEVKVYACTNKSLNEDMPEVNFKQARTAKQIATAALEDSTVEHYIKEWADELMVFDWRLKGINPTVILSHTPIDLLSIYSFPDLSLLESHTGVIKRRSQWHTKLNKPKDKDCIPFNKPMLCIFGDKNMIGPQERKVRNLLIEIGEKRKWTPLTTYDKISTDLALENEPYVAEFVRRYR